MVRRRVIATGLLLALIGAAALFAYRLVSSEQGLRLLLDAVQRMDVLRIEVSGARGSLLGPLYAEKIVVDHPAVHIEARGISADPDLRSLLRGELTIDDVQIAGAQVTLKHNDEREPAEPGFMPQFLRLWLPSLKINQAELTLVDGKQISLKTIEGALRISHSQLKVSDLLIDDPAGHIEGQVTLRAAESLGLKSQLDGHWRMRDERTYRLQAELDGDLDRLAAEFAMSEPARLAFAGHLLDLTGHPRMTGTLRATDFDGTPWITEGRIPPVSGSIAIAASGQSIGVDGTLASSLFGDGQLRLQGSGRWLGEKFEIAGLRLWLPRLASELLVWGEVGFGEPAPTLKLDGEWTALRWPLTGAPVAESPQGSYRLSGSLPYDFQTTLVASGGGIENAQLRASGRLERNAVNIDRISGELLDGRARASGRLSWDGELQWRAKVEGKSLDISRFRPDLQSRIGFAATLTGSGFSLTDPWSAQIDELTGTVANLALSGRGEVIHRRGAYDLRRIRIASGDSTLAVDGRWGSDIDLHWKADLRSLSLLSPELSGELISSGTMRGAQSRPEVQVSLEARDLRYGSLETASITAEADLDLTDGRDSRVSLLVKDGTAGGIAIDSIDFKGSGRVADHKLNVALRSSGTTDGRILGFSANLAAVGKTTLETQTWRGQLDSFEALFSDGSAELIQPVEIELSPQRASVAPLCLVTGEARLCAEGQWNRQPGSWHAIYSAQDWPLKRLLRSILGWQEFDGRLQASGWVLKEPGENWIGGTTLLLDNPTLDIPRNKFRSERVSLGQGRFDLFAEPEEVRAVLDLNVTVGTHITGRAQAQRTPGQTLALAPLRGELTGESAELSALPLFVPEIDRSSGRFDARVVLGGTLSEPELDGRFSISDGEFELYRTNLVLSNVSLDGVLSGGELGLSGRGDTPQGSMLLSGNFRWPDGVMTGSLRLKGERLLLADTAEYRVLASPDLTLRAGPDGYEVTGEVHVPEAMISPRDLSTSVSPSLDEHVVGIDQEGAAPSTMERVRSRILVVLGDNVRVDSRGLEARLGGEVTILTEPGEVPLGNGTINLIEGQYEAFGQKVNITRGKLSYKMTPLSDPEIDLLAEREIRSEDITVSLNVRGRLAEPYIRITSTPPMPANEALSYLLTGRSINSLQSNEASSVNKVANDLAISGGAILLGGLGRRVGLDEVAVERTSGNDTEVVLGKFLSPRLFVSYGISVVEAINTIKLRYTINRNWSATIEAGLNQSADLEYKIER